MKKKNKLTSKRQEEITKSIEKLKAFGLEQNTGGGEIEINGSEINGGKKDTTVETHWPTTGNVNS
uniref:Uncharacterized protein n=1 Tax=Sphingobacterium sp. (strain 21) TaxID=743722 RepID=F4C9Y7_SPHS2